MSKLQWKQAYERKLRSEMWQHSRAGKLIAEGKASSEELTALLEHDPEKFKKLTFLMRPYYTDDILEAFKEHREFILQGILPFKALPMIAKSDPGAITALARSVSSHHTKAILLKEGAPLHEARHVPVKGGLLSTKVAELATNHPTEFKNLFFRLPPYRAAEFLLHNRASFQELSDLYDEDQAMFEALTYAGSILVDDDDNTLPLRFAARLELARISIEGFKRGAAEHKYYVNPVGYWYSGADRMRRSVFLSPTFVTLYKNDPEAIEALLAERPKKILISEHSLISLQEMYACYKKDPDVFKALMGSDLAFDLLQRGQAELQKIHALYCKDPANFEKNLHDHKFLKKRAKRQDTLKQWEKKYPACQARDLIAQGIVSFEELEQLKAKNSKKFQNLVTLIPSKAHRAADLLLKGHVGFQELSDLYDHDLAMFRALTYRYLGNSGLYGVVLNGLVTWEQFRALADISIAGLRRALGAVYANNWADPKSVSVFLTTEFVTLYKNDPEAAIELTRCYPRGILISAKTSLQEMYTLYKDERELFNYLMRAGKIYGILSAGKASVETMRAVYHHDPKNFRENCHDPKLWKAIAAEKATRVATVHSAPKVSANESVGRFAARAAEIKAAELSKHTAPVLKVPTKEPVERLVAPQVVKSEPKPAPTPTEARVKKSAGRFTARAEEVQAQLRQWEQKYPKCQASELIAKDLASFDALAKLEATDPEKFKNLVLTSDPYRAAELLLKQKVSFQELSDLYDQDRAMFEKLTHKGNGNLYVLVRGDVIGWKQLTELADISLKGLKRGAKAWYRAYSASGGDKGTKAASVFLSAEFVTLYKNDPKAIKAVVELCPTDILLNGEASLKVMHALYRKDPANFAENCKKPEAWKEGSVEKGKHPALTKRSTPKAHEREPVGRFTEMAAEKRTVTTLNIPSSSR